MAEISAKDVMKLRNETGLPMMACKKALGETGGDVEAAKDLLRKQLKGKMDTRTDRAAGEGRIAIATNVPSGTAAIVELRAESDFTAKNESFVKGAQKIADLAIDAPGGAVEPTDEMKAIVDELRITTGENVSIARAEKFNGPETGTTAFGTYVHHDGKTGVLVAATGSINDETLRKVCLHIASAHPRPLGISPDDIPADLVEKERTFRVEQAMESGKPKEIAEKMVEGGMRKFFEEVALLEQKVAFEEGTPKVSDLVGDAKIEEFFRWTVGETG
jgi:elongation factor Ts